MCYENLRILFTAYYTGPFIHCAVTYSMAGMFNNISSLAAIAFCLSLNTVCYVSIGGALELLFDFIPLEFCTSTIVSQTSPVTRMFNNVLPLLMCRVKQLTVQLYKPLF